MKTFTIVVDSLETIRKQTSYKIQARDLADAEENVLTEGVPIDTVSERSKEHKIINVKEIQE